MCALRIAGLSSAPDQSTLTQSTPLKGEEPIIKLVQSGDAWISECAAPAGSKAFLSVEGADSASILLSNCDLRGAERAFDASSNVPAQAIQVSGNISAAR
jgi:hypothetical protein